MIIMTSMSDPRLPVLLLDGRVGVIATDTIYGLAALAKHEEGVSRIYGLKKRDKKLGTFIAADIEQLLALGLQEEALHSVKHLWPNPISIAVPTREADTYLDLGKGSLAVRIPKDDILLEVLRRTGPLVTSSANLFDHPPACTFEEAQAYFTDRVDFYVDVGDLSGRPPSTVARVTEDGCIEVLRQGAVRINDRGELV